MAKKFLWRVPPTPKRNREKKKSHHCLVWFSSFLRDSLESQGCVPKVPSLTQPEVRLLWKAQPCLLCWLSAASVCVCVCDGMGSVHTHAHTHTLERVWVLYSQRKSSITSFDGLCWRMGQPKTPNGSTPSNVTWKTAIVSQPRSSSRRVVLALGGSYRSSWGKSCSWTWVTSLLLTVHP